MELWAIQSQCTLTSNVEIRLGNFSRENMLQFVFSAHNGGLGKIKVSKEIMDRHKTYQ
jgi:hypothetical protein